MVLVFRFLLVIAIIILIYSAFKYLFNPKRKLELAHEKKQFFFLDDKGNVRKNFLLTHKGVLFEGEKQLGTTPNSFEIVSIIIWPKNTEKLHGLERQDFHFMEQEINSFYPNASIQWKSPVKEFLEER